ncbi:MAG: T9SS type A sorting domain-containing protein [Balneolaceae bacterium]|nr:T9SS type A sorting domain-containing protein [Balneolaceae bacterium]
MRAGLLGKPIFFILFFIVGFSLPAWAQSCPDQGTVLFPELSGAELFDALRAEYKTSTVLDYNAARDSMFKVIDNQNGNVTGVYTGYTITLDANADPSTDAFNKGMNTEHAWPQNKGATEGTLAHSDLHHLYPSNSSANSSRNREPFIDIKDEETESWWRNGESTTTPIAEFIDEYSERKDGHTSGIQHPNSDQEYGSWEPREDFKGDAARSAFYFYTMYKTQADEADPNFFEVQKPYLRSWNSADSVSSKEYNRTCGVASYQEGKVNPFVIDPTLADRLYFTGEGSQTVVEFAASALTLNEDQGEFLIEVTIVNPNADTATTVDFSYAGGTATAGEDFNMITNQTLTFAAGESASKTISLTIFEDDSREVNESILFALSNISGPNNSLLGVSDSLRITLRDNDGAEATTMWINEFHYDNESTDEGEFIEIAVNADAADLSNVSLSLYNGSNGSVYNTVAGTELTEGETQNGITVYYVEFPSNGIQNGSPDGISLNNGDEVVQFLSYEGTFTPKEGPSQGFESVDIGVEESNSFPLTSSVSLSGTGSAYSHFSWEVTETSTMGVVNTGQEFETPTATEEDHSIPAVVSLYQNYPNPFNPTTQIRFELHKAASVTLEVFTITGQKITTLMKGYRSAGTHLATFDATAYSSGLYIYRLKTAGNSTTRKMLLLK